MIAINAPDEPTHTLTENLRMEKNEIQIQIQTTPRCLWLLHMHEVKHTKGRELTRTQPHFVRRTRRAEVGLVKPGR